MAIIGTLSALAGYVVGWIFGVPAVPRVDSSTTFVDGKLAMIYTYQATRMKT